MSRDWTREFVTRRNLFWGAGGVAFAGLTARLAELQLFRAEEYASEAEENQIRLDPSPAARGIIYDRAGRVIASNKRNFYVTLRPEMFSSAQQLVDVVDRLSAILPMSDSRKASIIRDAATQPGFLDILVADDLTWEDFARVNVMAPELGGVSAEVGELRAYPYVGSFYHTVGYVQKANDNDIGRMIEADLAQMGIDPASAEGRARATTIRRIYKHPQMRVGKQGVEYFAESELKGKPGKSRVKVNAAGRIIDRLPSDDIAATPGTDIVMSIDAELQTLAIEKFGDEAGSCVVIDTHTGEIIVLATTPAPDPNEFVSGISQRSYDGLLTNEKNPLYHKAYDGTYPPGSTFKVVVAAAALESGAMSPETRVYCSGRAWYYDRPYHCWRRQGHGSMNMHTALQNSCDCYFYEAAKRTGVEAIAVMAKKFGLGHRYELGLTGGKQGVVPNDEWKQGRVGEPWYPGDTISVGIGQGYMSASPVQLAVMAARVAAGQACPNPKLLVRGAEVPDNDVTPMEGISPETMERVRAGMYAVTSEAGGTAVRAGALDPENTLPPPYTGARMAGKSGTAQVRVISAAERATGVLSNAELAWKLRDHALFVAYAPAENPRYAGVVVVEHGDSGSRVAAPILADVLAAALRSDSGAKAPYTPSNEMAQVEPHETEPT